jgi:large subunit ribosomal protein L19
MRHTAYFFVERISPVNQLIKSLEAPDRGFPSFGVGATVKVSVRIVRRRQGSALKRFKGLSFAFVKGTVTMRTTVILLFVVSQAMALLWKERSYSVALELKESKCYAKPRVRRAQLYYLRNRSGKAARLKEKRMNA